MTQRLTRRPPPRQGILRWAIWQWLHSLRHGGRGYWGRQLLFDLVQKALESGGRYDDKWLWLILHVVASLALPTKYGRHSHQSVEVPALLNKARENNSPSVNLLQSPPVRSCNRTAKTSAPPHLPSLQASSDVTQSHHGTIKS